MAKKALITGITGQDGSYLAEFLLDKGYEVYGMVRRSSTENFERIEHIQDRIDPAQADLLDQYSIDHDPRRGPARTRSTTSPPRASSPPPGTSRCSPANSPPSASPGCSKPSAWSTRRSASTRPQLQRNVRQSPRNAPDRKHALPPAQPLRRGQGLRPLHHRQLPRKLRTSSPSRASSSITNRRAAGIEFVTRKITDGVGQHQAGSRQGAALGNLDAKRDWGFAGDYVDAMWLMLQQATARRLRHRHRRNPFGAGTVEIAFAHLGLDYRRLRSSRRAVRPAEVDLLLGDSRKARRELGWEPRVRFEQLVNMMVDADLDLVKRESLP